MSSLGTREQRDIIPLIFREAQEKFRSDVLLGNREAIGYLEKIHNQADVQAFQYAQGFLIEALEKAKKSKRYEKEREVLNSINMENLKSKIIIDRNEFKNKIVKAINTFLEVNGISNEDIEERDRKINSILDGN